MPPAASMKRPAASTAGGAAKKPATSAKALLNQRCKSVSTALAGASAFPQQVRDLLQSSLPESLCVPKELRHPFQEQVIAMVDEVLKSVEAGIQSEIDAAEKTLSETTDARAKLEATVEAASALAASKAQATETAKSALAESSSAHKASKEGLASAESEQTAGDADLEAAATKKAKLESGTADLYAPLKEGTLALDQVKSKASAFDKLGKELGFEASLLASLHSALAKAPCDRGSFDTMVLEQAKGEMDRCRAAFVDTLEKGEPARNERAAKVAAASAQLAEAVDAERSCKVALEAAKSEQKEAEAVHKAAAKAVQQFGPEMKRVTDGFEASKADLENLKEGPLKAFAELLDYTAIVPPVEDEAPPAETESAGDNAPAEGVEAGPAMEPEAQL